MKLYHPIMATISVFLVGVLIGWVLHDDPHLRPLMGMNANGQLEMQCK